MSDKLLFRDIDEPGLRTLEVYERRGGYQALRKALSMSHEDVLHELQVSNIRGRGGAGFQMGKKASFLPEGPMQKYLCCNADESEPGTFKDREIMQKNPHLLIEGIIISSWAAGITKAFIYIRGEYAWQADVLDAALAEAGSMLGSGAIIVVDNSVPVVDVALKVAKFYRHESCGKCTPCREGTNWTVKMLERIERGEATPMDLEIMAG